MGYIVIGKFSEIDVKTLTNMHPQIRKNKHYKSLIIVSSVLALTLIELSITGTASAATLQPDHVSTMSTPTNLGALFNFISWLIRLLRTIVTSLLGLVVTFSGAKWATSIDGSAVESAKKIMKNAAVGALIVWFGTTITNYFVNELNSLVQ